MLLDALLSLPCDIRLLILALPAFIPVARSFSFTPVAPPPLNLTQLGRIALLGDFDSASLYSYVGQSESSRSANGSQSLLGQYPISGAFADLQESNGAIQSLCPYYESDGTLTGVLVGGNFTVLGGQAAQGMALYIPSNNTIIPVPGLTGRVNTIFCDNTQETATAYLGGAFTGGNSANAIAWAGEWQNLAFAGFDGPVTSIAQLPNGNLVFGGAFTQVRNSSGATTGAAAPPAKAPQPSIQAQPQVVNLGAATIGGAGVTTQTGYDNPANILCRSSSQAGPGNALLLQDDTPGYLEATFNYSFAPSQLRLYNSQVPDYSTKTWRFVEQGSGGILNFTYYNENGIQSCTADCPLADNATYQDFFFVNYFALNSFRIYISDWVGRGAGIGGIELFQNDIYVSAINSFNSPQCDGVSNTAAQATLTGPWATTPSGDNDSDYVTVSLQEGSATTDDVSVVFYPDIKQSGNYSVLIYTPGCIGDQSCPSRGIVNITNNLGSPDSSTVQPVSTQVYQTNNYQKYDGVYTGYINATSNNFRPSITLTTAAGQERALTIVAQRVHFQLLNSGETTSTPSGVHGSYVSALNGLYEFDARAATVQNTSTTSVLNSAGLQLGSGAQINAVAINNDITYIGGSFSSNSAQNVAAVDNGNVTALTGGGLNLPIQALYATSSSLYAAGNFTSTADNSVTGLNNVAAYSFSSKSWTALGAGVDGTVYNIVPVSLNISSIPTDCLAFSGYFSHVNAYGNSPAYAVDNTAIWVPQHNTWLHNLDVTAMSLSGRLTAQTNIPGTGILYAGDVSSAGLGVSGAVALSTSGSVALQQLPINIQPSTTQNPSTASRKRAVSDSNLQGVIAGMYLVDNGLNITVLGGSFTAPASNGSTITNLAFINNTQGVSVTGLSGQDTSPSAVLALAALETQLFAGGSGSLNFLSYDLVKATLSAKQPAQLSGASSVVNAIAVQPSSSAVYVGGSFASAGSLACPALCLWNTSSSQWVSPGSGLSSSGVITSLQWASNTTLILAGNMTVDGQYTTMARYDSTTKNFTAITGARSSTNVPGQITAFTPTDNTFSSFFVAGTSTSSSSFLTHYAPSASGSWTPITGIDPSSSITSLQLLTLTASHSSTALIPAGQTLLVTGRLLLPTYGNVSAALFNGTDFTPFLLSEAIDGEPGTVRAAFVEHRQALIGHGPSSGSGGNSSSTGSSTSSPTNGKPSSPSSATSNSSHLKTGYIILIALAISLALIFLLVLFGILLEHLRRRREGYTLANTQYSAYHAPPPDSGTGMTSTSTIPFGATGASRGGVKEKGEEQQPQLTALPQMGKGRGMVQRAPPEHVFGGATGGEK